MKITVLGLGTWGFCLARHLAANGHEVIGWTIEEDLRSLLSKGGEHPHLHLSCENLAIQIAPTIEEACASTDMIVESVTTKGLRPVLEKLLKIPSALSVPFVLTSKGIEQKTHLAPPDIFFDVCKEKSMLTMISGPSFAYEVAKQLPTAVVCGAWEQEACDIVVKAFTSATFLLFPNPDIRGVAFGGALKNIISIACGISDGLGLGVGARASLVTRGLHEMVKLAVADGCHAETLYGLSGLGDLYLTCSSSMSRNFHFGQLLSSGRTKIEAEKEIGMVVEGAYTCIAAKELAARNRILMPITKAVCDILEGKLTPEQAVRQLLRRHIKQERL
jgi:glycerol-3-phosphate dehydrogenase (NAD(P)+)